jgi:hypothetical protein
MQVRATTIAYKIAAVVVWIGLAAAVAPRAGEEAPPPAGPQTEAEENQAVTLPSTAPALRVAPGRVAFVLTQRGRWVGFGPANGAPILARGGVTVLGEVDGALVEILDARRGGLRVVSRLSGDDVAQEGASGGLRYPSARPDDDGDGETDEDCLDGVDNDGDGRVDEDFAAIGDEMVTATFATDGSDAADGVAVEVHQECYAWSLRHIDGMVAMRVVVRNRGERAIPRLRLAASFEAPRAYRVESAAVAGAGDSAFGKRLSTKAMVLRHEAEDWVAALFFSPAGLGETDASWITGASAAERRLQDLLAAAVSEEALAAPAHPRETNGADTAPATPSSPTANPERQFVYGVSPELGTLGPGDEVEVYVALVAPPSGERASRALDHAYRTVVGDGVHRMIPPPVSLTRRVVWGTYELRFPPDADAGVTVTLAALRDEGVNPNEIVYLTGVDLGAASRMETPAGDVVMRLSGESASMFEDGDKIVLHGRMRDGEWFDAVLQPAVGRGVESAEIYFAQAGKLDEALLVASPNPFRDATNIAFEVPARVIDEGGNELAFGGAVEASVKIYNVTGRLVSTLVDATYGPGRYGTSWAAQDEAGSTVASGVYYVKLQIGKRYITKRIVQLK